MKSNSIFQVAVLSAVFALPACTDDQDATSSGLETQTDEVSASAPESEQAPMDVRSSNTPIMPKAEYETIEFVRASAEITPEVREALGRVVEKFEGGAPVLLTIRMRDDTTIDAVEPTEQFKNLTPERVTAVKNYLQQSGVNIEKIAVDESGEVADLGEDAAMARADDSDSDAQHLILTLTTNGEPEPSASIPH